MTKILLSVFLTTAVAACTTSVDASPSKPGTARVEIAVTEKGFEPENLAVKKGVPTTLVFTRKTDKTCAKEVVLHVSKTKTIKKELPLGKPVEIAATFPEAGKLSYACGMNMITGEVIVQ